MRHWLPELLENAIFISDLGKRSMSKPILLHLSRNKCSIMLLFYHPRESDLEEIRLVLILYRKGAYASARSVPKIILCLGRTCD